MAVLDVMRRLDSYLEERGRLEEETVSYQSRFENILREWAATRDSVVINKFERGGFTNFEIRLENSNFGMNIFARDTRVVVVLTGPNDFRREFLFAKTTPVSLEEMKKTTQQAIKVMLDKDLNDDLQKKTNEYMSRFRNLWNALVSPRLQIVSIKRNAFQQLYFEVDNRANVVEAVYNGLVFKLKDNIRSDDNLYRSELLRYDTIPDAEIEAVVKNIVRYFETKE